jgi:flagellin
MLSVLNNISAIMAENQLSVTQANLQNTLTQLASGQRINSGSDDAAGLAIADGMQANIAALTQSVQNATAGSGQLQVADGALSQVTSLLNRAVTLATEASNGTVQGNSQFGALNSEFQNIMSEITDIGSKTMYNGAQVFSATATPVQISDGTTAGSYQVGATALGTLSPSSLGLSQNASGTLAMTVNPTANDTVEINGTTYTFVASASAAGDVLIGGTVQQTLQNLAAAISGGPGAGELYGAGTIAQTDVAVTNVTASTLTVTAQGADAGVAGNSVAVTSSNDANAWVSPVDGSSISDLVGGSGSGLDLSNNTDAKAALTAIDTAISNVASLRGTIGATINQLTAASNVINTQVQNLTSAENSIVAADVGTTVANMTKYNILEQTGMAALSQANQSQQNVLKLLQ